MFNNTPFKKGKKRSKNIVGRVVEVEGQETNENQNISNKFKPPSSAQKNTISSSVSRIFGVSPYKRTSTSRTPGRKFLKKLICTPGKSRSLPGTSVSEIDDIGTFIPNNSTSGLTVSRSTSSEETKDTISSIQTPSFGQMPPSPPRLARKLLEEDDPDSNKVSENNPMMKTPTRSGNNQISNNINSSKRVDDALVAASNGSGFSEDMIFLTHSSSSDEIDHRNENEANQASGMTSSSPYSSPQQYERQSYPSKVGHLPMKSPGIGIPTPAFARDTINSGFMNGASIAGFGNPHSLRDFHNCPMDEMNATTPNPKNLSTQFEEYDDDSAFLPDDFVVPSNKQKQEEVTFTQEQVERKIREAKREERLTLREQHEKDIEERQSEFEKVMIESGSQWKKDADEQDARYEKLLKEERHKTSLKHHELINKAQSLQDVKEALKEIEAERELLNLRVRDLEINEEKLSTAAANTRELENSKNNTDDRISELESEFHLTADQLKREKDTADQRATGYLEQLQALTESSDQSQSQLEEAFKEISVLREQLDELPTADPEEIRASKLEVENLRKLRAEDDKEIQALQSQLNQIVEEHRDVFTPQKKGANGGTFESPCIGEIDVLRVDYDKAQDQLKSMGKVLKRYKTERDDLKETIHEKEQLHIQAIEIAVKQATHDLKEKNQLLTEENEDLRQKPPDIGEQMIQEVKNHMEDLKKKHEEEIKRLNENLESQTNSAEEDLKAIKAQFEIETYALAKSHEGKIESLMQEMQDLRSNRNEEMSILRSNSKDVIGSLQEQHQQLKIEFENEKIEIIKTKSMECEALEEQIKSMNEMHNEELEVVGAESREEIERLNKKIDELQLDIKEKVSGETDLEDALSEANEKAKTDKDGLLVTIKSLKEYKEAEFNRANKLEAQIIEIQTENVSRIQQVREEHNRKIRELKSDHVSESDELLTQLDLIEAEATQRFRNAEAAVMEKDAVITALGSQLAESESRSAAASKEFEVLKQEIELLRSDLADVTATNEASQKEIGTLIERHKNEMEQQVALREEACNEAREEMIALAEGQLAERQEYYQALKRELDNAQSKISMLERDLRFATKELEEMGRRHESREADLKDELTQSKAAITTKEANLARAEKVHQVELQKVREAEKSMKSKFEESQATSHSIQKTLATMVTEKQRLEQEVVELTAISEELATLCEKNKLMES